MLEGRFRRRKGRRYYLEGVVMGKKRLFVLEGRFCWREGRRICSEGSHRGRKGAFSFQQGAFDGGKAPI